MHGASGRVADVTDDPVVAGATAIGEIDAAHRLDILGKAACQLRGQVRHDAFLLPRLVRDERKGPASPPGRLGVRMDAIPQRPSRVASAFLVRQGRRMP